MPDGRRFDRGFDLRSTDASRGERKDDHGHYKVRYRDAAGKPHSETKRRLVDAERRKAEIELDIGSGLWRDPRRGEIRLEKWAAEWIQTRHDLRLTTRTRLEFSVHYSLEVE